MIEIKVESRNWKLGRTVQKHEGQISNFYFPISIFLFLIIFTINPLYDVNAAFLYKSYVVRKDKGRDILCDPYIVQKNDWLIKLFKQRGEISQKDFPEFLSIFKRINPHIRNANKILPDQHIFIPLKILSKDSMLGQSSGIVTIPFVTISNIPEILKNHSTAYTVKQGDCLSRLIVQGYRTDEATTELYREGLKLFRLINPGIVDPDLIHAGQKIYIPTPLIRNQLWYKALFDTSGNIVGEIVLDDIAASRSRDTAAVAPSPLKQLSYALDARLLNKGIYYFPMQGEEDFGLDLSKFPVIELKNQSRIIFQEDDIQKYALNAVKSFWKNVIILPISQKSSSDQLFDSVFNSVFKDNIKNKLTLSYKGVDLNIAAKWIIEKQLGDENRAHTVCINFIENPDERIPDSICRYLESQGIIVKDIIKDGKVTHHDKKEVQHVKSGENVIFIKDRERKIIVNDLLKAMGYRYEQNINITFPYEGLQVEALSNLISLKEDTPLIVDFGNIYGEAIIAIKKAGMEVIQIDTGDNINTTILKILKGIGLDYTIDPMFFVAKRPEK
ncbi:MAG: LysM peptidoglycan-binding domain-containing protein, partial [Proteobacteria bacterium]|nr:LysM peptidoglycan-binding domain-containing protein [Pseudomonadota bacterium]